MANSKGLSLKEQNEAIEEIASSLNIPKKYIHYDFTDSPYFVIQDRNYQGNNRLEDEDRLYIEDFDFKLLKKYTLFFIECDIYICFSPACVDVDNSYTFHFDGCVFYDSIAFDYSYLCIQSFNARHCHFLGNVDICFPFNDNSYFEYCHFEGWVNFTNTTFKKDISFYGSTFDRCPNFSKTRFEGNINILNTNLDFDFLQTEKAIISKWLEDSVNPDRKTFLHFVANDFRDSFRTFKNTLSKEGNLLDASNYHRVELYCKEIELDSKNPPILSKEWIDKWQLCLYRHTSDHHTDLLRSFHTLIALIGIFGLLCGSVVLGLDYFVFDYQKGFDILQLKSFFFEKISKSIASHLLEYFVGNIALVFVFLGLFLGVMWECSRKVLIPLGYMATFGFLATSPKYLIPAMSLFGGKWIALNPLGTIGGIYTLLFGFLAYSFIKTARKNSIIPS